MQLPNKIITLEGVSMSWDERVALRDINFTVNSGDFIAITGPNGGGKTTLLKLILKLLKPTTGSVTYFKDGVAVDKLHIGYLPQKNHIDSSFPISVEQVIASGLIGVKGITKEEKHERVVETIALMGLENHRRNSIGELSGGQLQRTLLGRAIISRPEIIVLDEPLSYVDKRFESHIYEIVSQLAKHTTILLVSHEMTKIATMANRHLIIDQELHECTAAHHYRYISTECK